MVEKEDRYPVKQLTGYARSVYYGDDGKFKASTEGCGCCSDTYYDLNKTEALKVARSMVKYWQGRVKDLNSVSKEQMQRDLLEDANL